MSKTLNLKPETQVIDGLGVWNCIGIKHDRIGLIVFMSPIDKPDWGCTVSTENFIGLAELSAELKDLIASEILVIEPSAQM